MLLDAWKKNYSASKLHYDCIIQTLYTRTLHSVRRKINLLNVKGVGSNKDESWGIM